MLLRLIKEPPPEWQHAEEEEAHPGAEEHPPPTADCAPPKPGSPPKPGAPPTAGSPGSPPPNPGEKIEQI